jgi:RNA polymerase sigma-70 factor (ECF subfamily)
MQPQFPQLKTSKPDLEAFSDNFLMDKVRRGDLNKLGLLFERYKKPLFGFFYGLNKDAELSEDLVQNVFYRILRYREAFHSDGDFRTWMFHIARNVSHDHFRKNKFRYKESVENWSDRLSVNENRSIDIQKEEELDTLEMAMGKLPIEKREVLLLSKFHDKKYKEIGEILGCSEGAVKVKVFRAMQDLKEVFKKIESTR